MTGDKVEKTKQGLEKKLSNLKESLGLKREIYATEKSIRLIENRDVEKKRKKETRKKILIGAFYLEKFAKEPENEQKFLAAFDSYLVRNDDRALFNLQPLSTQEKIKKS